MMKMTPKNAVPIRVLLVEDNAGDARLVREYLEDAAPGKFLLVHVLRIGEALKKMDREKTDVVLLDLSLPDASGIEGFTRLARAVPQLPIIVLTGVDDAAIEKQLMALGARDYLRKQYFDGRNLAAVLANWVSLARASVGKTEPA